MCAPEFGLYKQSTLAGALGDQKKGGGHLENLEMDVCVDPWKGTEWSIVNLRVR